MQLILLVMKNKALTTLVAANLGVATLFVAAHAWAGDSRFSLSTGFDYTTGNYGTSTTTDILTIPAIGEYERGPLMIKVTVPYVQISGTGGVVPGIGHIKAGGAAKETQSGLGDTVAAATYNIYSGKASTFGVDLTGKIKLNTADSGLGSGQNDYAAQADAYQSFNKFTALGSVGYKILGSPAGISMNKSLYGSVGGAYQLDDKSNGGVDFSLSQSASATSAGQREITAYVSRRINKNFKAKGYVLKGFSNGSPDNGLGAQVYYGF